MHGGNRRANLAIVMPRSYCLACKPAKSTNDEERNQNREPRGKNFIDSLLAGQFSLLDVIDVVFFKGIFFRIYYLGCVRSRDGAVCSHDGLLNIEGRVIV